MSNAQSLVTIRDKRNGQTKEVWPVDAAEIIKVSPEVYEIVHTPYVIQPSANIPEKIAEEKIIEVSVVEEIPLVDETPLSPTGPEAARAKPGPKPKSK